MLVAPIDLQLVEQPPAESILRQHPMHRHLDHTLRPHLQELTRRGAADTARKAGVAMINFVRQLLAGQLHLGRIDDDDEVARILIRREVGTMLAALYTGGA